MSFDPNQPRDPNGQWRDDPNRKGLPSTAIIQGLYDDEPDEKELPDRSNLVYSKVPEYVERYMKAPKKDADGVPPQPIPDDYELVNAQESGGRDRYTDVNDSTNQMLSSLSAFGEDRPGFASWVDKDTQQLNIMYNNRRAVIDVQQKGPLAWNVYDKSGREIDNSDRYQPTVEHPGYDEPDDNDNLNDVYASMSGHGMPADWNAPVPDDSRPLNELGRRLGEDARYTTVGDPNYLQYAEGYSFPRPADKKPPEGWHYYSLHRDSDHRYTSLTEYDPDDYDSDVFATKEDLTDRINRGTFDGLAGVDKDPVHSVCFDKNVSYQDLLEGSMPVYSDQAKDLCNAWSNSFVGRRNVQSYAVDENNVMICGRKDLQDYRTQMRFSEVENSDGDIRVDYRSEYLDEDRGIWVEDPKASGSFSTGGNVLELEKRMKMATSFHRHGNRAERYETPDLVWTGDNRYQVLDDEFFAKRRSPLG